MSKLRAMLALVCVTLVMAGCQAPQHDTEAPALIAREDIFGNPERAGVQLSPDGNHISYLAPVDGVLNVWVGPVDDPSAAKPVTDDDKRGIRRYFWAYTNSHIVYLQDIGGDENWRAYSVDVTDNKIVDLTPWEGIQAQILQVSHKLPRQILVGVNHRNPQLHDVYVIDVVTGENEMIEENTG